MALVRLLVFRLRERFHLTGLLALLGLDLPDVVRHTGNLQRAGTKENFIFYSLFLKILPTIHYPLFVVRCLFPR